MDLVMVAGLAALALLDSTSAGTLVLPVLMMLQPRVRASRVLWHLAILAAFYACLGAVLWALGDAAVRAFSGVGDLRPVVIGQLVLGVLLFASSWVVDGTIALPARWASAGARLKARQRRALGPDAGPRAVLGVALTAGLLEALTLLPYLGAISLLVSRGVEAPWALATLAGYSLLMCVPAVVLLVVRMAAGTRVEGRLESLAAWMERHSASSAAWVVGIIGFLLAADAVNRL